MCIKIMCPLILQTKRIFFFFFCDHVMHFSTFSLDFMIFFSVFNYSWFSVLSTFLVQALDVNAVGPSAYAHTLNTSCASGHGYTSLAPAQ